VSPNIAASIKARLLNKAKILAAGRVIDRIEQGWSPVAEDRPAGPDEWAVIKLSAVSKGVFRESEHKALPAELSPDTKLEIREGDFLLTRANTPERVGDVCVVRSARPRLMLCDLVYRLQIRCDVATPDFLAYWFLCPSGRHQIEVTARGSSRSMVKVSHGLIRAWTVVLPSVLEQRESRLSSTERPLASTPSSPRSATPSPSSGNSAPPSSRPR